MAKIPGGKSALASYAAALFLIKEKYSFTDSSINKIITESNIDSLDFINENNSWFLNENGHLISGMYKINNSKFLNATIEEMVYPGDKIRITEKNVPIGDICGISIYEAIHMNTNQKIYIAAGELYK
jgi:hypothetical protein